MSFYLIFKALHIIGFVSWFAGLFYLVRMFVYHAESGSQAEPVKSAWYAQYSLMQKRVYTIIATPAMYITWICGLGMLFLNLDLLSQTWIKIKLVLVLALTVYHFYCKKIMKEQAVLKSEKGGEDFRVLNEVPTLFLVAIVLLAVCKDLLNFIYLFLGILAFGVLLMTFIKLYKKQREKLK